MSRPSLGDPHVGRTEGFHSLVLRFRDFASLHSLAGLLYIVSIVHSKEW